MTSWSWSPERKRTEGHAEVATSGKDKVALLFPEANDLRIEMSAAYAQWLGLQLIQHAKEAESA